MKRTDRLRKTASSFCFSFFVLTSFQLLATNSVEDKNFQIHHLSPELKLEHEKILKGFRTRIFQSVTVHDETDAKTGKAFQVMDPRDAMVDFAYDGDLDVTNNLAHLNRVFLNGVQRQEFDLKAQMRYRIRETKSHRYLEGITYHVYDIATKHAHDSETFRYAIRKVAGSLGILEYVLMNFHGWALIYSPIPGLQEKMVAEYLKKMDLTSELFEPLCFQRAVFELRHHKTGAPVWIKEKGEVRGIEMFCGEGGHALCKVNAELWKEGRGCGFVLDQCEVGDETKFICNPMPAQKNRILGFSFLNWDDIFFPLYPDNFSSLTPKAQTAIANLRAKEFEGEIGETAEEELDDGFAKIRPELPLAWAKGPGDKKGEANLPHNQGMKLKHSSAFPDLQDSDLRPWDSTISHIQVYNPDVIYTRLK